MIAVLSKRFTEDAARRNAAILAAYMWELDTAMRKYGIASSLPQLDVHVRSLFDLKGIDALDAMQGRNVPRSGGPIATLAPHERAVLLRNDAKEDTQRAIREDAQRTSEGKPPAP